MNDDSPYHPPRFPAQMYKLMGQPEAGGRCVEIFTKTNYDWALPDPLPTQMSELWELREAGVQCMNALPERQIEPSQIGDWMDRAMAKTRRITADLRVLDTALGEAWRNHEEDEARQYRQKGEARENRQRDEARQNCQKDEAKRNRPKKSLRREVMWLDTTGVEAGAPLLLPDGWTAFGAEAGRVWCVRTVGASDEP